MEPSYAVKRGNGKQTGGRRLAFRASLRPQLTLWLGLDSQYAILMAFPRQQWLRTRAPMLCYTYITCTVLVIPISSIPTQFSMHVLQMRSLPLV
jgi:hypothetical protein